MKNKEIVVAETLTAISGKINELRKAFAQIVPPSRKEAGCLQYDLFEPMVGSGEFLVLMRWKTLDHLKKHETSKHIQEFVAKYDGTVYGEVTQTEWHPVA